MVHRWYWRNSNLDPHGCFQPQTIIKILILSVVLPVAAITKYQRQDGLINNRSFFPIILEPQKPKITVLSGKCWIQVKTLFWLFRWLIYYISFVINKMVCVEWSLVKALISFMRHLSCDLIISQWSNILTSIGGKDFNTCVRQGHRYSVHHAGGRARNILSSLPKSNAIWFIHRERPTDI